MKLLTTILVPAKTTNHPDFDRMIEAEVKMLVDFHLEDIEVLYGCSAGVVCVRLPTRAP